MMTDEQKQEARHKKGSSLPVTLYEFTSHMNKHSDIIEDVVRDNKCGVTSIRYYTPFVQKDTFKIIGQLDAYDEKQWNASPLNYFIWE